MVLRRSILACLVAIFASAPALAADELTLYFYPSPGISWSSPKRLGQTAIANVRSGDAHPIGHVSVGLTCDATADAPAVDELTGATGGFADESEDLIRNQGYGLGVLFHTFRGRLYSKEEVQAELPARYEDGTLTFVTFHINPATCARLALYLKEYQEKGYDELYGLPNRPLKREGSGCSAFGVSFLTLAGLMEPAFEKAWSRELLVPERWVGGPLTDRRIPVIRFYNPLVLSRWARPDETHFPLRFYDPDLMVDWVKDAAAGDASRPSLPYAVTYRQRALGLIVAAEGVETPRGPIWAD